MTAGGQGTEYATHPGETDLHLPRPGAAETWHHHTLHTHYFGFSNVEAELGGFLYVRHLAALGTSQGGVAIFRGVDNVDPLEMEFLDYQVTMPWVGTDGTTITTANGFRIEFLEPGREARLTYRSPDGAASFELHQTAVTPLMARGHIIPGEDTSHDPTKQPGGMEQIMHCAGEVTIRGQSYVIDCHPARDRSWGQLRSEDKGAASPPLGWSPMYFDEDLVFCQVSYEPLDLAPPWKGLYDVPTDHPTHHFAWAFVDGQYKKIVRVQRDVSEYHPLLDVAMRQVVTAEDADGITYRFSGEAVAMTTMPGYPNSTLRVGVYEWTDEQGRATHNTYQEMWWDHRFSHHMKQRRRGLSTAQINLA
jgi:hypothetical protein